MEWRANTREQKEAKGPKGRNSDIFAAFVIFCKKIPNTRK
jgi:hypothetical protein